ncbi:hypothetical protein MXB_646 [Myxobolus squamalis]|nr:hypothetical protein MXB_646 [Myxobolus squamalis]
MKRGLDQFSQLLAEFYLDFRTYLANTSFENIEPTTSLRSETAVGKTSIVFYIAKKTGNNCIRINNHEHTDIQDYVGSYICNQDGLFYFQVGALVEAMKRGDWVVLDELNLAPSDMITGNFLLTKRKKP